MPLPAIVIPLLQKLLGAGNLNFANLTGNLKGRLRQVGDEQEFRTAAKEVGFGAHKAVSEAAKVSPEAAQAVANNIALQAAQFAESVLAFAPLAIAREAARNGPDNDTAVAAREKGEAKVMQEAIDIARVGIGDDPRGHL